MGYATRPRVPCAIRLESCSKSELKTSQAIPVSEGSVEEASLEQAQERPREKATFSKLSRVSGAPTAVAEMKHRFREADQPPQYSIVDGVSSRQASRRGSAREVRSARRALRMLQDPANTQFHRCC